MCVGNIEFKAGSFLLFVCVSCEKINVDPVLFAVEIISRELKYFAFSPLTFSCPFTFIYLHCSSFFFLFFVCFCVCVFCFAFFFCCLVLVWLSGWLVAWLLVWRLAGAGVGLGFDIYEITRLQATFRSGVVTTPTSKAQGKVHFIDHAIMFRRIPSVVAAGDNADKLIHSGSRTHRPLCDIFMG